VLILAALSLDRILRRISLVPRHITGIDALTAYLQPARRLGPIAIIANSTPQVDLPSSWRCQSVRLCVYALDPSSRDLS